MKKKSALLFTLFILVVLLLAGCQEKSDYEKLTDEEKRIVDNVYSHIDEWEITECSYQNMSTQGESCFRSVSFGRNSSGELFFHTNRALNESANMIYEDIYQCSASSFEHCNFTIANIVNASYPKSWDTTMTEEEKKNELARRLRN